MTSPPDAGLFIGLMSGTSLDGVDGVLVDFGPAESVGSVRSLGSPPRTLAHVHRAFPTEFAAELLALNTSGPDELHRAALAANALSRLNAEVAIALCGQAGIELGRVRAIGAHGQTVRHRPQQVDGTGYTVQLNNSALLAELCGIDVIADLRSRDVAAGGQGAPLVPAFHQAVFGRPGVSVGVLNLGGVANLSALRADGSVLGFDCGPGNVLMNGWSSRHTGRPFDAGGAWAATGRVDAQLLARWLTEPYFAAPPPKSTGRDLFNAGWLDRSLAGFAGSADAADVQATLAELTAATCAAAVRDHGAGAADLLVCGGGAFNLFLMSRLAAHLPGVRVTSTGDLGLPPDQVEAAAFAWLARAFTLRLTGSLPSVTGAAGPRVLGALYPGSAGPSPG